jgi:hypothetical protein
MITIFDDSVNDNEINNIAIALKNNILNNIDRTHPYNTSIELYIDALILEIAKIKFQLEGNK